MKVGDSMLEKENLDFFLKLYHYFLNNKKTILLFLSIGSLSAIVNLGSFYLLWKFAGMNYQLAVSVAYLLAVIVHFSANRCIAFERHDIHFVRQMPRYLTMIFINFAITLIITRFCVEVLSFTPFLGIVIAIGITTNVSYLLMRYWVFPRRSR
jgi:putative flippase GtrA